MRMTKTITYDGVEYRKVKRKAEVGDLITYNYNGNYSDIPRKVTGVGLAAEFEPYKVEEDDGETFGYSHEAYDVLVPIESEGTPVEASPSVIDLLSNIALRLTKVEDKIGTGAIKSEVDNESPTQAESVDNVNSPQHYRHGRFETIELIEDITKKYDDGFVAYCVGNAVKYVDRAPFKHGSPSEDLRKAAWYLTRAAEHTDAQ